MHRNVLFTFGLIVYFLTVTVGLSLFDAGFYTSIILLLGLPTVLLVRFSAAPSPMLVTVSVFGVGSALLLEGAANAYGLWYLNGPTDIAILGWITLEMLLLTAVKVVFLVLFYELLFDDSEYSISQARTRLVEFGLFVVAAVILIGSFNNIFDALSNSSAYYWITILLLFSSMAMLLVRRAVTLHLFDKIAHFVAVAAIPMLCLEFLLIANGHKTVISAAHDVSLPFTTLSLPFGEILLALSLPAFVTVVYELYLDDRM